MNEGRETLATAGSRQGDGAEHRALGNSHAAAEHGLREGQDDRVEERVGDPSMLV